MSKSPEWKREPRPGELSFHVKWVHGIWVSSSATLAELDNIHRQLHAPPPDDVPEHVIPYWGARDRHQHQWSVQQQLQTDDTEDWSW